MTVINYIFFYSTGNGAADTHFNNSFVRFSSAREEFSAEAHINKSVIEKIDEDG